MSHPDNDAAFAALLSDLEAQTTPPVARWRPSVCRDIDLRIDRRGDWHYAGSLFRRPNLVRLLAGLLVREGDDYYLVSPTEKLRITVEDLPFLVTDFEMSRHEESTVFIFDTNVGFKTLLDRWHPLRMVDDPLRGGDSPCLLVRDNLEGRLSRSVYYRLVDFGIQRELDGECQFGIESSGEFFPLVEVSW